MKAYESFSAWQKDQSLGNQVLILELINLVDSLAPQLIKTVKWGQGCWLNQNTPVIYIHTESDFVQLGFFNGLSLKDQTSLLKGKGKFVRFIKIENKNDIDISAITKLIEQVV